MRDLITRKTVVVNVNRGVIDSNTKRGTNLPALRIQRGRNGKPTVAHAVAVLDAEGREVARFVYDAKGKLLKCGARMVLIAHHGAVAVSVDDDPVTG